MPMSAFQVSSGGEATPVPSKLGVAVYTDPAWTLTVPAGTRTAMPLTATQNFSTLVRPHTFLNTTFDPYKGELETYDLRLNVDCVADSVGGTVEFELDIGAPFNVIDDWGQPLKRNAGELEKLTPALHFYAGSTFLANKGTLYVTSSVGVVLTRQTVFIEVRGENLD